jgi:hypothetical protein
VKNNKRQVLKWSVLLAVVWLQLAPRPGLPTTPTAATEPPLSKAPAVAFNEATSKPIWLAAQKLRDERGEMRWELLPDNAVQQIQELGRLAGDQAIAERVRETGGGVTWAGKEDCPAEQVASWPRLSSEEDGFLSLLANARSVFSGTIVDRTPGFLFGKVVTLLSIELDEHSMVEPPFSSASTVYVAFPEGRFAIDGQVFCGAHQTTDHTPQIGEHLVVLPHLDPADDQGRIVYASTQEMIFSGPDGHLDLPENLARDDEMTGVVTLDELLAKIELGRDLGVRQSPNPDPGKEPGGGR